MGLYGYQDDNLVYASLAKSGKVYWCPECHGPLKRRAGKSRFPHFYHVKSAPSCRLYSKTEDHMLAQIQLQKQFPPGMLQLERPFLKINRVADVCWEAEKIVFEIQCSPISEKEAEMRIRDYRSIGYDAVWLLDDKRYNRRVIRPAEDFLRKHSTYYLAISKSKVYDQFEVFSLGRRVKRSKQMPIDLQRIYRRPQKIFSEELFPKQILELNTNRYFRGDRLHRATQNHSLTMLHWRALEIQLAKTPRKSSKFLRWFQRNIARHYVSFLERLLNKN